MRSSARDAPRAGCRIPPSDGDPVLMCNGGRVDNVECKTMGFRRCRCGTSGSVRAAERCTSSFVLFLPTLALLTGCLHDDRIARIGTVAGRRPRPTDAPRRSNSTCERSQSDCDGHDREPEGRCRLHRRRDEDRTDRRQDVLPEQRRLRRSRSERVPRAVDVLRHREPAHRLGLQLQ